jgi:two-component system, OmpR family, phosphate regulon sensor histidine kinase PhoR
MILSFLTILFLGLGCVFTLLGLFANQISFHPAHAGSTGGVLLLLGSACALWWIAQLRRQGRKLGVVIGEMTRHGRMHEIEPGHQILRPLTRAINELAEMAQHSVGDAARRVKEMEIQLKVVAAERQDAQAILYSISDAVLVSNPFDELVLANDAAAKVFQFDLEQVGRAPVDRVVKDAKIVELIRDMRQSHSTSGRRIVEHRFKTTENGKPADKTFKITLSCLSDPTSDGKAAGVVAVLHDMTREKEVAELKSDFVSSVSHELRTPLASIKAYVEMLIDGEADDEKTTREFYEVIQNEANRLSRLIDNMLSISRIESGLVQVNKHPQSLTIIMKEAIEVIAPQARTKRIQIVDKLTPVFYQTVADKDMLYQAVLNLLSNAVKYTPEGGTVTVETIVDESKKLVVGRISDSGVGIPPKDLPFVFDKFYRSEANNHMAKGTGLGLSLVKHIVETVHHGRLYVQSEVGKGSSFGFELGLAD